MLLCLAIAYSSCENHPDASSCFPLPQPSEGYLTLMTLCSFVVAFFANSVLQRWWAVRTHIQGTMGGCYELLFMVISILSIDMKNAPTNEAKARIRYESNILMHKIIGFLVLTFRLLFNNAREFDDISDLVHSGLLTEEVRSLS